MRVSVNVIGDNAWQGICANVSNAPSAQFTAALNKGKHGHFNITPLFANLLVLVLIFLFAADIRLIGFDHPL